MSVVTGLVGFGGQRSAGYRKHINRVTPYVNDQAPHKLPGSGYAKRTIVSRDAPQQYTYRRPHSNINKEMKKFLETQALYGATVNVVPGTGGPAMSSQNLPEPPTDPPSAGGGVPNLISDSYTDSPSSDSIPSSSSSGGGGARSNSTNYYSPDESFLKLPRPLEYMHPSPTTNLSPKTQEEFDMLARRWESLKPNRSIQERPDLENLQIPTHSPTTPTTPEELRLLAQRMETLKGPGAPPHPPTHSPQSPVNPWETLGDRMASLRGPRQMQVDYPSVNYPTAGIWNPDNGGPVYQPPPMELDPFPLDSTSRWGVWNPKVPISFQQSSTGRAPRPSPIVTGRPTYRDQRRYSETSSSSSGNSSGSSYQPSSGSAGSSPQTPINFPLDLGDLKRSPIDVKAPPRPKRKMKKWAGDIDASP